MSRGISEGPSAFTESTASRQAPSSALRSLDQPKGIAASYGPLLLITLIGLSLRVVGLGAASLSFDEATSVSIGKMRAAEMASHLLNTDVHPPLYFLMLHLVLMLGDSEWQVRLPSAIFGACSIPGIFLVGKQLFDKRVALIAAAVLAVSPFHIYYSQFARPYALWALLSLLTWFTLIRAVQSGSKSRWLCYALTASASLCTHYFSIVTIVFQNASAFAIKERAKGWAWLSLLANLVVIIPFAVCLLAFGVIGQDRVPGWLSSLGAPALSGLSSAVVAFSLGQAAHLFPRYCRLASYLLLAGVLFLGFRKKCYLHSVVGCWALFLGPLLFHWVLSRIEMIFVWRYLLPYLLPYVLLLSAGLTSIRRRANALLAGVLLGLLWTTGTWLTWSTNQNEDWRSVTNYVLGQRQRGDVVVLEPSWYRTPFDYYSKGRINIAEADTASDPVLSQADRAWLIEPFRHHWTEEKRQNTRKRLSERFARVEWIELPQCDVRIACYSAPNSVPGESPR